MVPLAALVAALGVVIGLAFAVARIGSPPVGPASASGPAEPKRPRSAIGMSLSVLVAAGACILGVLAGRAIAYQRSLGGLGEFVDAVVLTFLVILGVVGLVLIGLFATKIRHGQISRAIATTLAAAGLLAAGTVGGNATSSASGGLYHQPVVLEAAGQTHFELEPVVVPFVAKDPGRAACSSVPDGRTVAAITALELGKLGSGTLRATLSLTAQAPDRATAEFFIDGADLQEGSIAPSWSGSVKVTEIGVDGASGKLTFSGLEVSNPAAKPDSGSSAVRSTAPGWPASLSGSLSWTCQPW